MNLCSVQVTELVFVFQTNKSLVFITLTELDLVCYEKTVRGFSKNVKNQLTLNKFFALLFYLYSYF